MQWLDSHAGPLISQPAGGGAARVQPRKQLGQPGQQGLQLVLGLLGRGPGREPAHRRVGDVAEAGLVAPLGRQPHARRRGRKRETGRHHADDPARHAVDHQHLTQHFAGGAEARAPFGLAQDHRVRPAAQFLLGAEHPAQQRLRLQQRHHRSADPGADDAVGASIDALRPEVGAAGAVEGHILETARVLRIQPLQRKRMPEFTRAG
jgi:hypothetical protein